MPLHTKLLEARKKSGLTQEELADRANLTVRTIQRIESGETTPRPFTIKALAAALSISFEELIKEETESPINAGDTYEDARNFLQQLCLSCFSYIVIPFIHFLIPQHLLNKRQEKDAAVLAFARRIIKYQIGWVIAMNLMFMLTLAYNLYCKAHFTYWYKISYLVPFFLMYAVNAFIILSLLLKTRRSKFAGYLKGMSGESRVNYVAQAPTT